MSPNTETAFFQWKIILTEKISSSTSDSKRNTTQYNKSSSAVAQWKMIMKGEMYASHKQKLPDTYKHYS